MATEIVNIKKEYIEKLRKVFPHVMKIKHDYSKHERKYIGVIFKIKRFNYYAPLSSPKPYDYNSYGKPKKNTYFVLKVFDQDKNEEKFIGKIILNCMIPVLDKYVKKFKIENIRDEKYRNLLYSEFKWINKNKSLIQEKAEHIYKIQDNQIVLPFRKIEKYVYKHFK